MRRITSIVLVALAAAIYLAGAAGADTRPDAFKQGWVEYKDRFVDPSGRVVDDANGSISHSEGQGYGLLLAYLAGDAATFEQIWSFTRTALLLRDDGLAVWKWDPAANPHVVDVNNASDGDILIASALVLAGTSWSRADLTNVGQVIAAAIGTKLVRKYQDRLLLMPAATGFGEDDRADGPVVNLSYWIFEAFPVLATVAPATDWSHLAETGRRLIGEAQFGPDRLPPNWLSVRDSLRPAGGFPPEFGYDALRIPLYLIRSSNADPIVLKRFREGMNAPEGVQIVTFDAGSATKHVISDPGYRIIPALIDCVLDGTAIPPDLRRFTPTAYYPATLQLLSLSYAAEQHPDCL